MIFFTTLVGAAQGLMLALVGIDVAAIVGTVPAPAPGFFLGGAAVVLLLCAAGLVAAMFHLGRPMRAWRAVLMWRTSWLSREVIVLPVFMAVVAGWTLAHALGAPTRALGILAALLAIGLFVCTGMIYAAVAVIREWASPLTPLNFAALGLASGFTLATAVAAFAAPQLVAVLAVAALIAIAAGAITRAASTWRNATLRPKTTLQTAIGVRHPRIVQASQGSMGGSFNTREFFHGVAESMLPRLRWVVAFAAFVLPAALLALMLWQHLGPAPALLAAVALQYAGLLVERWLFFAEGKHPQNLYYQRIG